jgi:hypothetical protein
MSFFVAPHHQQTSTSVLCSAFPDPIP